MKKWFKIAVAVVVLLIFALPFIPAELFRGRIQNALEQGLGRRVEIGSVHLTLLPGILPGPGFLLGQVLIHDDPRAGIEPFAYVEQLGASVRLLSLFSRKLEFSTLNIDDATINIVKPATGQWNYQMLLAGAITNPRALPAFRMRGGRINFKFGDTKALFYFNNADMNFAPSADGSYQVYFAGIPSRTDRGAIESGRVFVRGSASANRQLSFAINLEKTDLEDALRWISPGGLGLHGTVTLNANLKGPASQMAVDGDVEIGDVHRWDLLPGETSRWTLPYQGTLDISGEHLHLETPASKDSVSARLEASHWLGDANWDASAHFREIPFENLLKVARHMGGIIPELTATGSVDGSLEVSRDAGLSGRFELLGASATPMSSDVTLKIPTTVVNIAKGAAKLEKTVLEVSTQSAEIEAAYQLQAQTVDFKFTTKLLDLAAMRTFGVTAVPFLRETPSGTWRGSARYTSGGWTGDLELRDASFSLEGLASPVEMESALVSLGGRRASLNRMRAVAGGIHFTGDYHWEPDTPRPHRFVLNIPEADAAAVTSVLAPTLLRDASLISRTLRLGATPQVPTWLAARHAEGDLNIGSMKVGDTTVRNASARVQWDGASLRLNGLKAVVAGGTLSGDLVAELSTRLPKSTFTGKFDTPFHAGSAILEGTATAGGNVTGFFEKFHSAGTLHARAISLAPGVDFRSVAGDYDVTGNAWKFSNIEAVQGAEKLTGTAVTDSEGKLELNLSTGERKISDTVPLFH